MMSMYDFLIYSVLACALAFLWYYSRSTYNYWRKLNVKYLEPVPLFGNSAKLIFQWAPFHEVYQKFYKALDNEPFGGIYQMRQPQLIVKDPELVSNILIRDFKHFCDHSLMMMTNKNKKLNPLSMHLLFAEGEHWRVLRQKMSPMFSPSKVKQMQDQIFDCVFLLIENIDKQMDGRDSMDVALKGLFEKLTIDVIGSCAFGIECNSLRTNEKLGQMMRAVFMQGVANAIRIVVTTFSPRLVDLLKLPDIRKDISDYFVNLILDSVEYRRRNGVSRNDLLQLLMELQNSHVDPKFAVGEPNKKLSTDEEFDEINIAANAFFFFLAGYETTASTLSYCLYELALNQDIQEKLRSEVQHTKTENQTLTYEGLRDMTYMNAVITETLRKYPPVVLLNRVCTEEYVIPGTKTRIPEGTDVIIPVWSIQHDWKNYPNPEVFDPDRFMGDNKYSRPSRVFLPFGDGPRYCIGKRFADMEVRAALSEIILRFDIKPCSKTEIPLKFKPGHVVLHTTCGTWVNMEKRKQ